MMRRGGDRAGDDVTIGLKATLSAAEANSGAVLYSRRDMSGGGSGTVYREAVFRCEDNGADSDWWWNSL